ncbi:FAD-dependent oxidoreductase [Pendulispora albinea]|uniref:FAD-dependent oxidoreductase n=1 Tax=Pendulispora albinea TaxID=2741071 RepID=A0ABZ2M521_9BACT
MAGTLGLGGRSTAWASSGAPGKNVAVLGGGVGGLTAAHELAERGFSVVVYEPVGFGGKARSIPVPGTGRNGRKDLPGEHGFRFFPGFYQNLPDTMSRIPFPGNRNGCLGNLIDGSTIRMSRAGGRHDIFIPLDAADAPSWLTPEALRQLLAGWLETNMHLPPNELAYFANRILVFLTSCDERRFGQWEHTPWWDFVRAAKMSPEYQRMLALGVTRNVVATKAEVASTWTVAHMVEAFLWSALRRGNYQSPDRLLDAPTNEAWIHPWLAHLASLGVQLELGWKVTGMALDGGAIAGATVTNKAGATREIKADWYVCAIPIEHCRTIWGPDILAADPALRKAVTLDTDWMVGLQYFLRRRPPIVKGHVNYMDSPWALTSICQAQFWPQDFAKSFGDGTVVDCLSVDISEWNKKGILYGKTAKECTRQQVAEEVWAQLRAHLEDTGDEVLPEEGWHSWHLDPAVTDLGTPGAANSEQLLIHPVGTLGKRPNAVTKIPNLFLGADYVRNDIDLATMEGANEAGRMAANGVLEASGSTAPKVTLHTLYRAPELEASKAHDQLRYRLGLPNLYDLG